MLLRQVLFVSAILAAGVAAAGERVPLWPAGKIPDLQDHQIAAMSNEAKPDAAWRAAHRMPYVEWYDPPAASNRLGACMIVASGGGYVSCCNPGLVDEWRRNLTALGFQCVNLVYRTPRPKGLVFYKTAWEDGQRAVRLVRSEAKKRGFDPEKIGMMSISAGAHLTVLLGTSALTPAYARLDALDDVPCHLNWAIPFATAYALTDGLGIANTRGGDAVDVALDSLFAFDAKTCPMCLLHGGADVYSPTASTQIYRRLRAKKIPAEVHLFADKPHWAYGFDRAVEFMRQMGFLGPVAKDVGLLDLYESDAARGSYEKFPLWPAGKVPDARANQLTPYLEWHMPKKLTTTAIQIIYSGGSYTGNSPDGAEVAPARRYLNGKGMAVVTMRYRTPRPVGLAKHTTAWQDLQRCIRLVRQGAAARGLDPNRIGIMGSSAGGHLTLVGVTSALSPAYARVDAADDLPCDVQWGVAIYPAYLLEGRAGSERLVPELVFDPKTPPVLFVHGDADVWPALGSVMVWEQMRRMGVQSDLHTLATRGHCFQFRAAPGTGSYTYLDRIWDFLSEKKFVAAKPAADAKPYRPPVTWRGGTTLWGRDQPYGTVAPRDLAEMSYCNPCAPLLLSNAGEYLWSDKPFTFWTKDGVPAVSNAQAKVERVKAGTTLRDAYRAAMKAHFPPSGKRPLDFFFTKPQYNTWIESCLTTNNQAMVEGYVRGIVTNAMPAGVLMVDDGWAKVPGDLKFDPKKFPDPKGLFRTIHAAGMKAMLWITPYVNLDSEFYRANVGSPLFYKNQATGADGRFTFYWGNPEAACLDLTRRANWEPIRRRYDAFLAEYGVDGFKFDFTDAECLRRHKAPQNCIPAGTDPVDGTAAWGDFAAWGFPVHELRAGWKFGGKPLVVRLQDKGHSWADLRQIVPDMVAAGLLGCPFVCPDMIGGGSNTSFKKFDRKLFIRSCEAQTLMPMMQFSCAPWRVLDAEGLAICRRMSALHVEMAPYILKCADDAARTGEPIVRSMEYAFPHQGFDGCNQQFMLGEDLLVAPVVTENDELLLRLPEGTWVDEEGIRLTGPTTILLEAVPLGRLPRYRRVR